MEISFLYWIFFEDILLSLINLVRVDGQDTLENHKS